MAARPNQSCPIELQSLPDMASTSNNSLDNLLRGGNPQFRRLVKLGTPLGPDWLLPLYVKGHARLGRDYEFIVDVVSSRGNQIELKALLGQPVTLWLQQTNGSYLPFHGYVHRFTRLGSDGPLSFYQLRFSSWMYFLRLRRDMRDWQEQSGQRILADVFNQHPQAQGAFRFELNRPMPSYSTRVQWEYDWNFVHRSLEELGVFAYFEQAENGQAHTAVFTDDVYFVPPLKDETVLFGRMHIGDEMDGFTQWGEQLQIESAALTTRNFDYQQPDWARELTGTTGGTGSDDALPADGEVYDYTGAYTWSDSDQGAWQMQVRLEEMRSRMSRFIAVGGLRCAMPGRRFTLRGHPVHDAQVPSLREFVTLATDWSIRNNLPGMEGIAEFPDSLSAELSQVKDGATVRHADGSAGHFMVTVEAQRRRVPYRSPFEHYKPVMQLQNAIVATPDGSEIYTDALNRVLVWFPWNRRRGVTEHASCWVRASHPEAGDNRGAVQPLRKGDEVLVGFMAGDCDRPVIVSRLYGGHTLPPWHTNGLLSGLKSKEYGGSGYNQLVLDDSTGQNRVHLYSTSADSHLHLGYLIQQTYNTRGSYLGTGFDLKSTAYGAIRAGQGLYVSTYPATAGQPLDVRAATAQLVSAESVMEAMSDASTTHQAESLTAGHDALKAFTDATQSSVTGSAAGGRTAGGGTGSANGFAKPQLLVASPSGIALSTAQTTQIVADQHVNIVSGQSTHIATGKSLIAGVAEKISLFVQNAGMKLFAAKGKVQIQAHSDNIELTAQKTVKIVSAAQTIEIAAKQEILLTSGGAYIRIKDGNIDIHAPGNIDIKGAQHGFSGPTSGSYPLPTLPEGVCKDCLKHAAQLKTALTPRA
jgi:type VI secretion system secreted protein VgrG